MLSTNVPQRTAGLPERTKKKCPEQTRGTATERVILDQLSWFVIIHGNELGLPSMRPRFLGKLMYQRPRAQLARRTKR